LGTEEIEHEDKLHDPLSLFFAHYQSNREQN
jgi:hypothetical protein